VRLTAHLPEWMEEAIWSGDSGTLRERAACVCCCDEHTFENCPARLWGGCRGQGTPTREDVDEWARHYGVTLGEFLDPPTYAEVTSVIKLEGDSLR
jgi:hypothetical protein